MDRDEFYSLNPKLFKRYRVFYEKKFEESRKRLDESSWMDGIYVAHAIGATFSKNGKYPKAPEIVKRSGGDGTQQGTSDADIFAAFAMKFNADHFARKKSRGDNDGKTH